MGLLDRFKKQKEKELATSSKPEVKVEKAGTEGKDKGVKSKEESKSKKVVRHETARIILAPLVTEKAAHLAEAHTYVFRVDLKATRVQIAAAFKELYGVQPTGVNVVNVRAEAVRFGRSRGKQKAWKKAYVQVPAGKHIQVYEAV